MVKRGMQGYHNCHVQYKYKVAKQNKKVLRLKGDILIYGVNKYKQKIHIYVFFRQI